MLPQKAGRFLVYLVLSYHILLYICFITFCEIKYLFSLKLMACLLTDIVCLYNLITLSTIEYELLARKLFFGSKIPI